MRILKVWDYEYPWDVRVEKICRALTEMRHDVHMVARNRKAEPLKEDLGYCTVHRMKPVRWAGSRVDAATQFPAFFNPRWTGLIEKIARKEKAEVILVRDIPLAPAAIRTGKKLGIPVVLDMAEHYAAMIRDLWSTGTTSFGDFFVRNPKVVAAVEEWVLARIDHTIVVVEESKARLVEGGVPEDKISVVSNTPSLARVETYAEIERNEGRDQDVLQIAYLGLMEEARGVGNVIEAVAAAKKAGSRVSLDLIGEGRSLAEFKSRAKTLGLGDETVTFHGFLPYQEALGVLAGMDAGVIPHFANESWETTIPNKLFDYMSLGLPVISSNVTPVARVLEETQAGVTFLDRNTEDLTKVIQKLDHADLSAMGERGVEAVRGRYHWEQDAVILKDVFEQVLRS